MEYESGAVGVRRLLCAVFGDELPESSCLCFYVLCSWPQWVKLDNYDGSDLNCVGILGAFPGLVALIVWRDTALALLLEKSQETLPSSGAPPCIIFRSSCPEQLACGNLERVPVGRTIPPNCGGLVIRTW